jgi:putative phosphoribosyl transferase
MSRATTETRFRDRRAAGRELAAALGLLRAERPIVVGLPRGGVVLAYEIALALGAPLDVVIVRKLGAPSQPEYALGAVGEDDVVLVNERAAESHGLRGPRLDAIVERERGELERRSRLFRGDRPPLPVTDRTVVLVDDGIATGSTARAAAHVLRERGAARIVLAVAVGPPDVHELLAGDVDEVVCLRSPRDFYAVGQAYEDFAQTTDDEVEELLRLAAGRDGDGPSSASGTSAAAPTARAAGDAGPAKVATFELQIPVGAGALPGTLSVPEGALGLVVFAHGSGSSRLSPRNAQVAAALHGNGLATLLIDLLHEREAAVRANVFDIDLLARRLVTATRIATAQAPVAGLPVGYFGASTGAAAALCAAADLGDRVRAVVSRGGRPDLALHRLAEVTAATLFIVGGADREVLALNELAAARLYAPHELVIVPGATHLFEEPGALERVSRLAGDWLRSHLTAA